MRDFNLHYLTIHKRCRKSYQKQNDIGVIVSDWSSRAEVVIHLNLSSRLRSCLHFQLSVSLIFNSVFSRASHNMRDEALTESVEEEVSCGGWISHMPGHFRFD